MITIIVTSWNVTLKCFTTIRLWAIYQSTRRWTEQFCFQLTSTFHHFRSWYLERPLRCILVAQALRLSKSSHVHHVVCSKISYCPTVFSLTLIRLVSQKPWAKDKVMTTFNLGELAENLPSIQPTGATTPNSSTHTNSCIWPIYCPIWAMETTSNKGRTTSRTTTSLHKRRLHYKTSYCSYTTVFHGSTTATLRPTTRLPKFQVFSCRKHHPPLPQFQTMATTTLHPHLESTYSWPHKTQAELG